MKVKSKGGWKSIPMPHTMFENGMDSAMCGGIEVLEDYSLNSAATQLKTTNLSQLKTTKKLELGKKKRKGDAAGQPPNKKSKNMFIVEDQSPSPGSPTSVPRRKTNSRKKKKSKDKPAINPAALERLGQPPPEQDRTKPSKKQDTGTTEKISPAENIGQISKSASPPDVELSQPGSLDMSEWREMFVCEEIISALAEKGFTKPTPIQKLTLPAALKGMVISNLIVFRFYFKI